MRNKFWFLVFSLFFFWGCKKTDVVTESIKQSVLALEIAADSFSLAGPKVTCTTALDVSGDGYTYGFCYAATRNPVIPGPATGATNYAGGSFSTTLPNLEYGKFYYVKAFVTNGYATQYSNEDSFAMPQYISTGYVKNITSRSFMIDITMAAGIPGNIDAWGICYAARTKPIDTNFTKFAVSNTPGVITLQVNDTIRPGVNYYVRSLVKSNGVSYYGSEVTFKTAGYRGSSGAYVIFDKGDTTAGWRYIETTPDTLIKSGLSWGCSGTLVPGLSSGMGAGYENSNAIVAGCNTANTAAASSRSLAFASKTDWYLPDADELDALYQLKLSKLITKTQTFISSSQSSANECLALDFSTGLQFPFSKTDTSAKVWPIRRY